MTWTGHNRLRYSCDRSRPMTLYTIHTIIQSPLNTLNTPGQVWSPLPATTGYFIIRTGHCRRLYMRFTQLGQVPQNTLKIHGCVLWHLPVTTGYFIIRTGHCRRLYMRFTQWGQVLQNTLKIHGCVLWLLPVMTDYFIYVPHKNWGSGRPTSVSNTPTPAVLCPPSGL